MFCPKCGNEIQDSAASCSKCGAGIGREKDAPTGSAKRNRKGILAVAIVAVTAIAVAGWLVVNWHGPDLPGSLGVEETRLASVSDSEVTIGLLYPVAWGEPENSSSGRLFGEYINSSAGKCDDDSYTSFEVFMLENGRSIPWDKVIGLWEDYCETDSTLRVFPNHELVPITVSGQNALQWHGDVSIDSNGEQLHARLAFVFVERQGYLCGGAEGCWISLPDRDISEDEFNAIIGSVTYSDASDDLSEAYSSTTYIGPGVAPPGTSG